MNQVDVDNAKNQYGNLLSREVAKHKQYPKIAQMRGWQGGWIEGQLVVESGLPEWHSATLWARSYGRDGYILNWPDGIDASRVQRVNGSWSEGAP